MTGQINRRQLLMGAGAAAAAAGASGVAAASASGSAIQPDGSWTGVVAAIDGDKALVDGDAQWRAVASESPLRVGDEVAVGPVDIGGPDVVSPLFRSVDGDVQRLCITNRADGSIRTARAYRRG